MQLISLIIPVYDRPEEVRELLETLAAQTVQNFEVIVVEDGSSKDSRAVVDEFAGKLEIAYCYQPNGGPASARNKGASIAKGDFFVFMDSDCLVPKDYFETVERHLSSAEINFYGGADSAAPDFSPLQKAVSYSMTSILTTGGIRGKKKAVSKFMPRSFNMGIRKSLFEQVGGFTDMRIGEDIDFSIKVMNEGVQAIFLEDAMVCHKRRTSVRLFFKQVFIFGVARINLNIKHPASRKAVYALPMLFTLGSLGLVVCGMVWSAWFLLPFALLALLWFVDSALRNKSLTIGWLSVWTSFIQLYGYGMGYMYGIWMRRVRRMSERQTYKVTKFFSRKT